MMMMLQMSFLKLRNRRAGNTEFYKFFFFLQLFVYFLEIHQKMHNFFTSYAHLTVCLMQNKTKEMKDTVFQNDPKCLICLPKKIIIFSRTFGSNKLDILWIFKFPGTFWILRILLIRENETFWKTFSNTVKYGESESLGSTFSNTKYYHMMIFLVLCFTLCWHREVLASNHPPFCGFQVLVACTHQ